MSGELSAGQKAALTRKRRAAAKKAVQTRKRVNAFTKARAAEAASKEALRAYCEENGWRVAFFEGKTGAPRTGIIDAVAFRIARGKSDVLDLRLIQLKGGNAGVSGPEIARLKRAVTTLEVDWLIAAFDGETLHLVPELPKS
jgi:cytochrome c5